MLSLNGKNVQHVKIYLPCNFEVNSMTYFGIIALFSSNFQNFNTFHSGQVWFKLAQWFQRRRFFKKFTDGCQVMAIAHTGELKIAV
jgi:hypothetical protein